MTKIKIKEIKSLTKENLKLNFKESFLVVGFITLLIFLINSILNFFLVGDLLLLKKIIIFPFTFGGIYYFLNLSKGNQSVFDIFYCFTSIKVLLKSFGIYILFLIGLFISTIPVRLFFELMNHTKGNTTPFHLTIFNLLIILIAYIVILLIFSPIVLYFYSYILVPFIFLENIDLSIIKIFKKSRLLMKGYKLNLFILQLSIVGWLGIPILLIIFVHLLPSFIVLFQILTFIFTIFFIFYIYLLNISFYRKLKNLNCINK